MRSFPSPLLARWVMSVLRITGQRPERGAGFSTVAAIAAASSTPRSKRSTSWRRKLRAARVLAVDLLARAAQLEHREPVAADGDQGGRRVAMQEAVRRGECLLHRHARELHLAAEPARDRAAAHAFPAPAAQDVEQPGPRILVVLHEGPAADPGRAALADELHHLERLRAHVDADEASHGACLSITAGRTRPGRGAVPGSQAPLPRDGCLEVAVTRSIGRPSRTGPGCRAASRGVPPR